MRNNLLTLAGAVAGGVLGYLGFLWLARQGYYALVLPGGLAGIGAGLFKSKSIAVCVACGGLALAFGLFSEWRIAPFLKDESLGYFLAHVFQLKPFTLLMLAVGAGIGFLVPFRSRSRG